jgi:hypothetical protein
MQPLYIPENAVPPEQVRFEDIDIEPLPEERKVRVRIGITPFTSPRTCVCKSPILTAPLLLA